jgi:hypothetical protein
MSAPTREALLQCKTLPEMAKLFGAVDFSPPPMRAVRGLSFTFEQLEAFAESVVEGARYADQVAFAKGESRDN